MVERASQVQRVAVLAGGRSAEREVSLRSGAAVFKALQAEGLDVIWFDPAEQPLPSLAKQGVDIAFIALHGRGGEDGEAQAVLNCLGIPFTGSDVLACALAMDKSRTKYLWQGMGLPTAESQTVPADELAHLDTAELMVRMGGKVMVKPSCEGSSIGMAVAESADELKKALANAAHFDTEVLVERWLSGPEYTVSILADEALPSIRVHTPSGFYDYQAKYESNTTEYHCPAGLSMEQEQAIQALALRAFKAVGGKGWGRVDLMLDAQGNAQLLEVNMVPGMTEKSLVPMAAKQHGLSFSQLVMRILASAQQH